MFRRALSTLPFLALFACGGGSDVQPAGGVTNDAGQRDTLVIGYQSDIGNLIPVVYETAADSAILQNINYPVIDSEFDCSLKKQPALVKSWEWSEDGKVLAMELRDDISWADGTKVTAHDIAFTYDLIATPEVASPRISFIERMVEGKRPLVIDDTHLEWHFTEAYDRDTQIAHASMDLVPKHLLSDADLATLRGHEYSTSPVPTGPFKLSTYEPANRIVLEPNEKFTGPEEYKPNLKRVIFRIIPEYSTRLIELQNGKIDMMEGITVADADMLRKSQPNIELVRRGWRFMDYVGWNLQNPKFSDVRVRRALARAVNVQGLIDKLLTSETGEAYGRPAIGTITPELCGVYNEDVKPYDHDLEAAKALFAEAGWTDTDGDGILDKDGKPFEFTLTTNTGNKRRSDAAVLIQAQLKDAGVRVHIEKQESNAFFENLRKKEFEAALAGWSAGLFVDPSTIWHSDTPERKYEFNFVSYSNPEVDALIEKGLTTPRPEEAAPIWKEMQAKIYEDQPYLFLFWRDEIVGIDKRFENTEINVLSSLNDLHEWSVPADKVKYKR